MHLSVKTQPERSPWCYAWSYNTTGEPLELVPSLMGLVLHVRGKAVILGILPGIGPAEPPAGVPGRRELCVLLRKHRRVRSRVAPLTNEHLFLQGWPPMCLLRASSA